jgi:hypothetical protein
VLPCRERSRSQPGCQVYRWEISKWREYNPEDTLRFYALRLHEVGMVRSSPKQLITAGTDWRFLHEIKRELKA